MWANESVGLEAPLRDLLRENLVAIGGADAIHIDGRWLSGFEVIHSVQRCAHLLHGLGIETGARIGTLLPNNAAFLLVWLATIERNLTLVPINVNLTGESLRQIIDHAELDTLVLDESALSAYLAVFGERRPCRVLVLQGSPRLPAAERFAQLLAEAPDDRLPDVSVARSDPALIIYTSGTTGLPKGVLLSRAAQRAHAMYYGTDFVRLGPGETGYTCLPLFHVTSMGFTLGCLLGGARIAIDPHFNPFSFWGQIRCHGARMFPYVGAMIGLLASRPARPTDALNPAVRAIGSATPSDLWEEFERRFGLTLIETYGQTELASLWLMPPPEGRRVGTVGRPAPRMEIRLVDAAGRSPPVGSPGELLVRPRDSLLMTQEYFRDSEATATAFRSGWYHTGDALTVDADGHYRFVGRLKDFIRRRGENISAATIEGEALSHPAVEACAAVGVPAMLGEEEIKLCVVPKPGMELNAGEVARYLRSRLATFMQPRYIEIRSELPRTATQRIQKFRLVEEGLPPGILDRRGGRLPESHGATFL